MTSKGDNLKTSEFLRLRKLRLQQVREQSKDIAKKIRQRAKVEQLKHVSNIDTNKEKIYLQQQERLVNRLEELYSKGIASVGASHRNAAEINQKDIPEKKDLSKIRGKEATAELRRIKQAKLDEQKKFLDRKLQARDAANELSREKSVAVLNNLTKSGSAKNINKINDKSNTKTTEVNENSEETQKEKSDFAKNDMGTQWDFEEIPKEWEPDIPPLSLPKDGVVNDNDKSDKNKRLNLFALSDEMPSSLRGGVTSIPDDRVPIKPSLTLVSEYLQNRNLRLRQPDTTVHQKKSSEDLQSIKQTLLRTRASRTDGSVCPTICQIHDEQVVPVPCWRPERNCNFCSHKHSTFSQYNRCKSNNSFSKSLTLRPGLQNISISFDNSKPWTHGTCHHRHKIPVSGRSNNIEKACKTIDSAVSKKNSVTMYDHNTRDTRDLPHNEKLVVRDESIDDDAYSQAVKESEIAENNVNPHHRVQQEMRNRIAVTKQNVEKEYRDTLAFLNSLPKEKPTRSTRIAYMDGDRQQELRDKRQDKLQKEYKKVEKDCNKHHCRHSRCKSTTHSRNRSKSKSPPVVDNNLVDRNFQYSWLPVPESDGSLAIHTIPNTMKDKPGNTVKFSSVDTYHEYRSRHKHTPPTKDVNCDQHKRIVEAVIIDGNSNDSMGSSYDTDTSSVDNLQVKIDKTEKDNNISDAERIIIYKVMESKKNRKQKAKKKDGISIQKENNVNIGTTNGGLHDNNLHNVDNMEVNKNTVSFNQVKEGIYKSISTNRDNIASMYFTDGQEECRSNQGDMMNANTKPPHATGQATVEGNGCDSSNRDSKTCEHGKTKSDVKQPSAATSTTSFRTAFNDKGNVLPDSGYIKFIDDGGQDAGKFYVGASGFLKNEAYEVVIQLRKKEAEKNICQPQNNDIVEKSIISNQNIHMKDIDKESTTVETTNKQNSSPKTLNEDKLSKSVSKESLTSKHADNDLTETKQHEQDHNDKQSAQTESNVCFQQNTSTANIPKCDKNTGTSFHDSFAILDSVPKSNDVAKPTTSTYTQTAQSSPLHRPPLMHLSSSTSTTYMSPPDVILPKYLRKGCSDTDHTYERFLNNKKSQNSSHKECAYRCNKCTKRHTGTPPNTTRSTDQTTDNCDNLQYYKHSRSGHKHKNVKPHKCVSRSESKISGKHKFKRCSNDNKRINNRSNYSTLSSKKSRITNHLAKANLNPVVENYVKKLLALNKEGLKAIEVINQECSGVATPSSSIIDVPSNVNQNKPMVNKISLEQIKNTLKEQILKSIELQKTKLKCDMNNIESQTDRQVKPSYKSCRKRPVHKVKSLNISKHFIRPNTQNRRQSCQSTIPTTSPLSVDSRSEKNSVISRNNNIYGSKRMRHNKDVSRNNFNSNRNIAKSPQERHHIKTATSSTQINTCTRNCQTKSETHYGSGFFNSSFHRTSNTAHSSESETYNVIRKPRKFSTPPISISTQTNQVDSEAEFMKLAENKLQNMEKIADLTEKCTKRLSNLAKVLEEVRKNKSLAYSQISASDTTSDSDQRSDKNVHANNNLVNTFNPTIEIQTLTEALTSLPTSPKEQNKGGVRNSSYVSILKDIPKPDSFKTPSPVSFSIGSEELDNVSQQPYIKVRAKPPPALVRNLKHVPEGFVIPHELSTVVEVDSPMSVKHKSHTTRRDKRDSSAESSDFNKLNDKNDAGSKLETLKTSVPTVDYYIRSSDVDMTTEKCKTQPKDKTANESKIKMMDLKQFNEIMLKPFISLHDYAKQYNLDEPDEGSNHNIITKDEHINEELSSLHSETSLPDVMAELLKRNLISEPFKFETSSNVNSTTVSSESTLSMLALSRARKEKKKSGTVFKNKENIAETSESLSLSSNPDLENAFQKLGMGWASSTLKKTKERLALSSSSNTSTSSMPHFKIKSFNYQDVSELSKDSIIALLNNSNKKDANTQQDATLSETAKDALQQTSLSNSMTVKEFLDKKLAKKITFSNKSNKNVTEDDFISLCETKIPEEMKHLSDKVEDYEKSVNSPPNTTNNRARTSTPVQIFKSMTYHSTSSSNTSNGLFSNADELSSVKVTSNSNKNHSTSDKDDLTIPNYSLKIRMGPFDCSKSD